MAEEVLVSLFVLAVGLAGTAFLFWSATEKLRVLLSCLAWRRVEAVVVSSGLLESRSTHWVERDQAPLIGGPGVEVEHDPGFHGLWAGRSKVTTTTVMPRVSFRYEVGGRTLQACNLDASWNHSVGYAQQDAAGWVAHFAPGTKHPLRVNPRAPREVFLGWRHFPWVWAPLQWVLGFFLGPVALAAASRPLLELLTDDGHAAAQGLMVLLGATSPVWVLCRALLDLARREKLAAPP